RLHRLSTALSTSTCAPQKKSARCSFATGRRARSWTGFHERRSTAWRTFARFCGGSCPETRAAPESGKVVALQHTTPAGAHRCAVLAAGGGFPNGCCDGKRRVPAVGAGGSRGGG